MSSKSKRPVGWHIINELEKARKPFPRYTTDPNPDKGELGFKFVGPKKEKK